MFDGDFLWFFEICFLVCFVKVCFGISFRREFVVLSNCFWRIVELDLFVVFGVWWDMWFLSIFIVVR